MGQDIDGLCEKIGQELKDDFRLPEYIEAITDRNEAIGRVALELARFITGRVCDQRFTETREWLLPEDVEPERFSDIVSEYLEWQRERQLTCLEKEHVEEVLVAFLACYPKVRAPYGYDPLELAVRRAQRLVRNGNSQVAFKHPVKGVMVVVEVARELQRMRPKDHIYLPQQRASELMGVTQQSISRYIDIAVRHGRLKRVQAARRKPGQRPLAALYSYVAEEEKREDV